jgi:hypothetical protein
MKADVLMLLSLLILFVPVNSSATIPAVAKTPKESDVNERAFPSQQWFVDAEMYVRVKSHH